MFSNVAGKATSAAATLTVATHHYVVLGWGENASGQLGDGNTTNSDVPVPVGGLKFVTSVAAGARHSLALLSNGTVMAWGENATGQLGDGRTASSDVPVAVEGLTGVEAIAAGNDHSLALLSDGTVMAWGDNEYGQLGDGTTENSEVPVAVKGLTGVTAIAAGGEHSLALLSDGKVMAWGENEYGQLGDGNTNDSNAPVAVKGLTGVTAIAAGGQHSLALLSDGTVMAWGDNEYGQLGHSATEEEEHEEQEGQMSDVPVTVEALTGVKAIAAGGDDSLALLNDDTVMAWGEDTYGELGDGSITRSHEVPVAVSGLSGVAAISAGSEHSMALLSSGKVMAWGENKHGELGNGSSGEPSDVPVAVSDLSEVAGIAAGGFHDLTYGEPTPNVTSVEPNTGSQNGETTVTIAGTNFGEASAVDFGGNPAKSFTVNPAGTSITAVSPAGTGTVHVTVTTAAGTSAPDSASQFTYAPPPAVTKVAPSKGPAAGESTVTITGTNFHEATTVDFGATPAKSFTVNPAGTSITAVSPAATTGTVDVTVTTPYGTSATSSKDHFKFEAPTIAKMEPNAGPAGGGTSVTVTGSGFGLGPSATTFKFGKVLGTSVNCTSTTTCVVVTPAGKAGIVAVTASVGATKSKKTSGDQFTYE